MEALRSYSGNKVNSFEDVFEKKKNKRKLQMGTLRQKLVTRGLVGAQYALTSCQHARTLKE